MTSPSPGVNRIKADVLKLIDSKHEVTVLNNINEFVVRFDGPQNTPYAGGVWRVRVDLPEKYPFKSPSIGFTNRIFHPNIDEISGTVCLDVINQTWSPMYDLTNVFETFLPQLLAYPNPSDPLNGDAAALFIHRPEEFKRTVKEYVRKYASDGSAPVENLPMVPDFSELLPISHTNGHHSSSSEIETSITHAVSEVSSMPSSEVAAHAGSISDDDDDDDEDVFEADVLETFPCPPPVRIDLITPRSSRPVHSPVPTTGIVQAPERIARSFRGARRNLERIISRHQTIMQRTLSAEVGEAQQQQQQWHQPSCSNGDSSNNRTTSNRRWTIVLGEEEGKKATGGAGSAAQSEAGTTETKKRRRCITLPCSLENISDESDMSDFDDANL